jgi:arginyl-tRNA synthetase
MAKNRTVYHVLPDGEKGWKAENIENKKIVAQGKNKEAVVKEIKEKTNKEEPSQVIIHKSDGTFQYESTYGDDPREYKR